MSLYIATVRATGSTLVCPLQPALPGGVWLLFTPSSDFFGTIRVQQDQGPPGNPSLVDVVWPDVGVTPNVTTLAGNAVVGGQSGQQVASSIPRTALVTAVGYNLYATASITTGTCAVVATNAAQTATTVNVATSMSISGLTISPTDAIPLWFPEDLAFQFQLAKDQAPLVP